MGRHKKQQVITIEENQKPPDYGEVKVKEITSLSSLPDVWLRAYSLANNEDINSSFAQYTKIYSRAPENGWLYTNSQNQRILYLEIDN